MTGDFPKSYYNFLLSCEVKHTQSNKYLEKHSSSNYLSIILKLIFYRQIFSYTPLGYKRIDIQKIKRTVKWCLTIKHSKEPFIQEILNIINK